MTTSAGGEGLERSQSTQHSVKADAAGRRRTWRSPRARSSRSSLHLTVVPLVGCSGLTLAQAVSDVGELSIEELSEIEVTSVSRRPEPIRDAPAAVYVISGEDIRRSGAATLAEALRLAPNLEVARVNSQSYAISS